MSNSQSYYPLVSIVLPVFNAEKSVEQSLLSILNQTYRNIEVIVIDDGSSDSSLEICQKIQSSDSRIYVINQSNSGPSAARMRGLDLAHGQYVQFVDSDDLLTPKMTEILVNNTQSGSVDIVVCGYFLKNLGNQKECIFSSNQEAVYNKSELKNNFIKFYQEGLIKPLWNKLYRREILTVYNIRFDISLFNGEDYKFNLECMNHASKVKIISNPLYQYTVESNFSLSKGYKKKYFESRKLIAAAFRDFISDDTALIELNKFYYLEVMNDFQSCFYNIFHRLSPLKTVSDQLQAISSILDDSFTRGFVHEYINYKSPHIGLFLLIKYKLRFAIYFICKFKYFLINQFIYRHNISQRKGVSHG